MRGRDAPNSSDANCRSARLVAARPRQVACATHRLVHCTSEFSFTQTSPSSFRHLIGDYVLNTYSPASCIGFGFQHYLHMANATNRATAKLLDGEPGAVGICASLARPSPAGEGRFQQPPWYLSLLGRAKLLRSREFSQCRTQNRLDQGSRERSLSQNQRPLSSTALINWLTHTSEPIGHGRQSKLGRRVRRASRPKHDLLTKANT